jgi:hypothetical protein|tara:strand:- start:118 stop:222 length:105 start_codon:yes stop_codon:yes gene_type:complete
MFKLLIGAGIGLWIGIEFTSEVRQLIEVIQEHIE